MLYSQTGQGDNTIQRMRIAWWKVTDPHSEYVIVIAFPQHQLLRVAPQSYVYPYVASDVFMPVSLYMRVCYLSCVLFELKYMFVYVCSKTKKKIFVTK